MSEYIFFAQHGWADNANKIQTLAKTLAPNDIIIAPNLGWWKTWIRIEPLIEQVEQIAIATLQEYPDLPWRIIGHSMGGLIWLELLHRHPEWRSRVHSLILVASPVGGANLAKLFDPFAWGIGIAKDLGKNRRAIAEEIPRNIPTLVIAGDIDGGSDGTIVVGTTQFAGVQFKTVPVSHPALKNHPSLIPLIREFWSHPVITPPPPSDLKTALMQEFRQIPGVFDAHYRDFPRSRKWLDFNQDISLRTWTNPFNLQHIFLSDRGDRCFYAAFILWQYQQDFAEKLYQIQLSQRAFGKL